MKNVNKIHLNKISKILSGKDRNNYHFHFVGIGGVSMFSLAMYMKELGQEVSGSDSKISKNTKELERRDIRVCYHHETENVWNCHYLIYSNAVENNVEVKEAKRLNIPAISRAELLGEILKTYKLSICVAGAHGKTTTTALIYEILKRFGVKPSLHLGGELVSTQKSYEYDGKDVIVCEACEYKDSFLNLKADLGVILNMAPEHLDYFKTFDNVKKSFLKFSNNSKMVICSDKISFSHKDKTIFGENGYVAKHIGVLNNGNQKFDVYRYGEYYGTFTIPLLGKHNIQNSLAAICVADRLKINYETIKIALENFKGVKRRFEYLSNMPLIIHDYAHHPDEIKATLLSLRSFYSGKLLVVFQPHTYTRSINLKKEFKECFNNEQVIIYKTYSAREKYQKKGSARELSKLINNSIFEKNRKNLASIVRNKVNEGYAVIFLGAGDINKIAEKITREISVGGV